MVTLPLPAKPRGAAGGHVICQFVGSEGEKMKRSISSMPAAARNAMPAMGIEPLERRQLFDGTYQVVDLGTLGGSYSLGAAINAAGDVTGEADLSDFFTVRAV